MKRRRSLWLVGCAIPIVALLGLFAYLYWGVGAVERGRSATLRDEVVGHLQTGMTRAEAEHEMDGHVRRQYHCDAGYGSIDVYMFGSRDPKRAGLLYLRYREVDGEEILEKIAGLDPDMLPSFVTCEVIDK